MTSFGCTLFSFTNEWLASRRPLEVLLERVAAAGLGPDLEVDGLTSFRGLPVPYDEEVVAFRATCARLGLRPTVFGVYLDRARRADRWLDAATGARELERQLVAAQRLGFATVRAALGLDLAVVEAVCPLLDALDLTLTLEVQGTTTPESPSLAELVSWLEANAGAPVGMTLDSSVAMAALPESYLQWLRGLGMSDPVEELLVHWWPAAGPGPVRFGTFRRAALEAAAPMAVLDRAVTAFVRMGNTQPRDWRHLLPWVRHVHAKLWDGKGPDERVLAPQRELLGLLHEVGYRGSVSSEWGGSEWFDLEQVDALALTRRHLDALRGPAMRAPGPSSEEAGVVQGHP